MSISSKSIIHNNCNEISIPFPRIAKLHRRIFQHFLNVSSRRTGPRTVWGSLHQGSYQEPIPGSLRTTKGSSDSSIVWEWLSQWKKFDLIFRSQSRKLKNSDFSYYYRLLVNLVSTKSYFETHRILLLIWIKQLKNNSIFILRWTYG